VPEDGKGWGYQLEGFVSYRVTQALSLGIGGRYWHMQSQWADAFREPRRRHCRPPAAGGLEARQSRHVRAMSVKSGPYSVIDVH
jgi:hypothetical protein